MDTKEIKEFIKNEQKLLREELKELKKCQLQYFIVSVASTGVIFGLIEKPADGKELFFLAPLLILIPCWWTFFDKAHTITRLVGYLACLEGQLLSPNPKYIGYETGLQKFRQIEDESKKLKKSIGIGKKLARLGEYTKTSLILFMLPTRHRYWMINWYTFLTLTSVCCLLPLHFGLKLRPLTWDKSPWYLSITAVIISITGTFWIVIQLKCGKYSIKHFTEFWKTEVFRDASYSEAITSVPNQTQNNYSGTTIGASKQNGNQRICIQLKDHIVQIESLLAYLLLCVVTLYIFNALNSLSELHIPFWIAPSLFLMGLRLVMRVTNPPSSLRDRLTWASTLGGAVSIIVGACTDIISGGLSGQQGSLIGMAIGGVAGFIIGNWIESGRKENELMEREQAFNYLHKRRSKDPRIANPDLINKVLDNMKFYDINRDGCQWYTKYDLKQFLKMSARETLKEPS